ncbi:MAG: hypothetical protein RI897_3123 [Verrucomicrobiota bacterium]|jgi:heptosyltransferase-2
METGRSSSGARILVVRGGALGDFILTLPVLAALRGRFPGCVIELMAYPQYGQLAVEAGYVDQLYPIESRALAGFFAARGKLDTGLAAVFERAEVVVSYLFDPDAIFETNVRRCIKGQFLAGPHRPDDGGGRHAVEVLLSPLERLAIFDAHPVPRLTGGNAGGDVGKGAVGCVAVHPGSGSERKNWPEGSWGELLERFMERRGERLLLVGGEAEGDRLERLAGRLPRDRVEVARSLGLVELSRLLRGCRGFLGHDSGVTHLAAAVGLPCLVLWGPTVEGVWRPRGERIEVLRSGAGLAGISVSAVFGALEGLLSV